MRPFRRLSQGAAVAAVAVALLATPAPSQAVLTPGVPGACAPTARTAAGAETAEDTRPMTLAEERQVERVLADRGLPAGSATADFSAVVPVHVHVVTDEQGTGAVSEQQVADQITVLNETYGGTEHELAARTGFTFVLRSVDTYADKSWFKGSGVSKMRSSTRVGGADALNIWTVGFDLLGVASFPWDYAKKPDQDGILVSYSTLPGGSETNYDQGKTATHEVGHWLGLYHTFSEGCSEPGDRVDDTPFQAAANFRCPEGADTCVSPGLDPIHNYMNYTYDACMDQFTPGQSARMVDSWAAYRAG